MTLSLLKEADQPVLCPSCGQEADQEDVAEYRQIILAVQESVKLHSFSWDYPFKKRLTILSITTWARYYL